MLDEGLAAPKELPGVPEPRTLIVVVGVLRDEDQVLLVNQYRSQDPHPTWALPGGRAELGETLLDTLTREVSEETGLEVREVGPILGITHTVDSVNKHQNLAFIVQVLRWEGSLAPADPDEAILGAEFIPRDEAISRLRTIPWDDMREPSIAAVLGEQPFGSLWLYGEEGKSGRQRGERATHISSASNK